MDVKNEDNNGLLAGVSFPPPRSPRAPRVSLAPKTPFPFLFKRLPRMLALRVHLLKRLHLDRLEAIQTEFRYVVVLV